MQLQAKSRPTFYFIGVTTSKSSIMSVFPGWMKEIGRGDVVIEGLDCKIHDDPAVYREIVSFIKDDPKSLGGLVTTHKIDLLAAARSVFDYLDPYAEITGEISSISKHQGRLEGHAKDPITVGLSMRTLLGPGYFARTGGHVVIFGAGGSSVATVLHLMNEKDPGDRPERIVVVNRSQGRLDAMKAMIAAHPTTIQVECLRSEDPRANDEIMERAPAGSVVINATGMGKDIPGSPITDGGRFPMNGIAWEFNYRGELDFLHQAAAQEASRALRVEDGWLYFLHGWTQVVAQVLHIDLDEATFGRLSKVAAALRKR